jgi:hypothetical protein
MLGKRKSQIGRKNMKMWPYTQYEEGKCNNKNVKGVNAND